MRISDWSSDVCSSDLIARSARLRTVLRSRDPHFRRGAMLGGRTIARQLDRHRGHASFEQLALPCAVVAADLVTGDAVVLNTGNVAEAVRASMALPGIFHPVIRDGRVLVDGGVIMPVPVEAVRSLAPRLPVRSEEHTSELQSLMRISYATFCLN